MDWFIRSKIATFILLILILLLSGALVKLYFQKNTVQNEAQNIERRMGEVKKSNDYLEKLTGYFKSPAFLERQARAKLNYKYPDEEVAVVYKEGDQETVSRKGSVEDATLNIENMPNLLKWIYYIRGY